MFKARRLRKYKKEAAAAVKYARRLNSRYGAKAAEGAVARVEESAAALESAIATGELEAIKAHYDVLQELIPREYDGIRKSPQREYFESIGIAVLVALLLRTFIIEAFTIPSGSMIPTLAVGDFLFVNKLSYGLRVPFRNGHFADWSIPERGDVIVFVFPCNEKQDYIKRVVGLPGDVVDVDRQGFVWINGEKQAERLKGPFQDGDVFNGDEKSGNQCIAPLTEYVGTLTDTHFRLLHCGEDAGSKPHERPPSDWAQVENYRACQTSAFSMPNTPRWPWKVPEGHVYVMGDNRGNSADSRYWGFVPMGNIKGKAMFIWLSWDGSKSFTRPWEKVRWDRMFRGVHRDPG